MNQIIISNKETEKRYNDYAREQFKEKLLKELLIDLQICTLMNNDDPLQEWKKYIEQIKKEIDELYERVSNRKT